MNKSVTKVLLQVAPMFGPCSKCFFFIFVNGKLFFYWILCCLAFICHHNSFMIYGSLKEPTLNNWTRVTHVSVGSATLVSVLFAATGYFTFTVYTQGKSRYVLKYFIIYLLKWDNVFICIYWKPCIKLQLLYWLIQGDLFENYCKNDNLATFGRFCYGLSIITTFPLECLVTREVWYYCIIK